MLVISQLGRERQAQPWDSLGSSGPVRTPIPNTVKDIKDETQGFLMTST